MRGKYKRILPLLLALLLLCGCGSKTASAPSADESAAAEKTVETAETEEPFVPYEAPEALFAEFHAEHASGEGEELLDLEHVSDGYITVCVVSDAKMKLRVLYEDESYVYSLYNTGRVNVIPVQLGDGLYTVSLMQNVVDSKYTEVQHYELEVTLTDPLGPFLVSNDYVSYTEDSDCIAVVKELAAQCADEIDVVSAVYDYICEHITYDYELAATVEDGYMPDLDAVLAAGTGICFDYASLAAAMLRYEGIPTKVIFGYVAPEGTYHAWNMFYTEESGWVTVDFHVSTDSWNRLDLTFAANGADDSFIGDGTNYTDVYFY